MILYEPLRRVEELLESFIRTDETKRQTSQFRHQLQQLVNDVRAVRYQTLPPFELEVFGSPAGNLFENINALLDRLGDQQIARDERWALQDLRFKIYNHYSDVRDGTFFHSLEQVWKPQYIDYMQIDEHRLDREIDVTRVDENNLTDPRYGITAGGGMNPEYSVTESSIVAESSSVASSNDSCQEHVRYRRIGIFGDRAFQYQSQAHLMPRLLPCSVLWFPVVPWVLKVDQQTPPSLQSLRKHILGFCMSKHKDTDQSKLDDGNKSEESNADRQRNVAGVAEPRKEEETNTRRQEKFSDANRTDSNDSDEHKQEGIGTEHPDDIADSNRSTTSVKRQKHAGVKDYPTNRICMKYQKYNFEFEPRVIIVPILEEGDVRRWNGDGYSAIVLAGPALEGFPSEAGRVYSSIGAGEGGKEGDFLATMDDLNKATCLLQTAVQCVAKSRATNSDPDLLCAIREYNESCVHIKQKAPKNIAATIPIPVVNDVPFPVPGLEFVKIRKIKFTDRFTPSTACHAAPDPALLLANASSTWLIRQNLMILPRCVPIYYRSSDSSEYTEESESPVNKKPRMAEIECSTNSSGDDNDAVSDLEEEMP